jgi:hypothetical protein
VLQKPVTREALASAFKVTPISIRQERQISQAGKARRPSRG